MSQYGTALYTNGVLSVYRAGEVEHSWFVIVDDGADNLVRRVGDLVTAQAMVDEAVGRWATA